MFRRIVRLGPSAAVGHRFATIVALLLILLASRRASAEPLAAQAVTYRAGSASASFGPATAAGDFDADGKPDFAIADRLPTDNGADYVVEVRLSGGPAQILRFGSAQRALAVTAIDVDHDHDLDLVFRPVVGRRIVIVWLNDGAGHFTRDDSRAGERDLPRGHGIAQPRIPRAALALTASPRRLQIRPAGRLFVVDIASAEAAERHLSASIRRVDSGAIDVTRGPPSLPSLQ